MVLTGAFKALLDSKGGVRAASALPVSNRALLFFSINAKTQLIRKVSPAAVSECTNLLTITAGAAYRGDRSCWDLSLWHQLNSSMKAEEEI